VPRPRTVLIAGAGIGGLAAAIALAKHDFHVIVFERDETPDTSGAGIQLSPNATRALASLGVLDALKANTVEPDELIVANALSGAPLATMPLGAVMREKFGSPYLVCLRADLHQALAQIAASHPNIELRYGNIVSGFKNREDGVIAQIEGNTQPDIEGVALIGADGIRSSVRTRLHPGAAARHGGMSAWRATIPASDLPGEMRAALQVRVWLGPGAHLVHYPVGDGAKINLVAVTADPQKTDSWGEAAASEEVVSRFAGWNEIPRGVIALAPQFRRWSIYEGPLLSSWGKDCVTLLGDAAHGMFPFIAQGAASALEDAVALAGELSKAENASAALRAYEQRRMPRTREMQSAARNVGRIYHMPRPFSFARDMVMKQIGGGGLLRQNDWIYRG
jgi:salicylate hydroxylase